MKLCEILHHALVEIRLLGWSGRAAQAADLANVFHEMPHEMYGWGCFNWRLLRRTAMEYREKYPGSLYDYVAMLDVIRPPETI